MKKVMLFIVSAVFSVSANAASFNFVDIADTGGEFGAPSIGFSDGGVGLTATASAAGFGAANAYLDTSGSQGPAGLGVCKVLSGTQCSPSSDDNVLAGEKLTLEFDQRVLVTDVAFNDGGHGTSFSGTFELIIDTISQGTFSLSALASVDLWGTTFEFLNNSVGDEAGDQFYIANISTVPVPAALFLFAPALLGFFGLRRKATLAA